MTAGMHVPAEADRPIPPAPPLLSIIIPSLEADLELRRCVDSIRLACSERRQCEVLVVMPADRVGEARALLPLERVVAERRAGIYAAMNDGIEASTGRYLYFLGKDDVVLPPFGDVIGVLESRAPSVLFFDVYWGTQGTFSGRPSRWRLLLRNLCHQGIVYSREALARHGPYVRKMRVQADHLLNIRILWDRALGADVHYLNRALTWYSGAGFSVRTARDPVFWRLYPVTMRRYVGAWAALLLIASRKLRGRRS